MKRTIQSPTAVAAPIEKPSPPASVSLRRAKDRFSRHPREAGPVVYRSAVLLVPAELDSAIESR
jgi:hypothetical protein